MKSDSWKSWALPAPSLSAVFLLLVIPVCLVVVYSFWLRSPNGTDISAIQLGNFTKFFEDFFYPKILIRTIRISLETVILCVVMGYIAAYYPLDAIITRKEVVNEVISKGWFAHDHAYAGNPT